MKKLLVLLLVFLIAILITGFLLNPFRSTGSDKAQHLVTFDDDNSSDEVVGLTLQDQGYIRSLPAFDFALSIKGKQGKIEAGGYYLSKNMDMFAVIDKLSHGPDLKWVLVPEGIRKEQIGERLQKALGWSDEELKNWNKTYTAMKYDDFEGVYFPDTYLIPVHDSGLAVANRMIANFNEKFAPYSDGFAKKDIIWTTGLKIASIVQREAAGKDDMPIIAGVLWNRLLAKQKLQIDATVQYAKGKVDGQWWSVVTPDDIKNIDSPYNTYEFSGLPPHPISNPGITAIDAALNPAKTDCLYYIHDHERQIHCSKTYQEHLQNIKTYLQ